MTKNGQNSTYHPVNGYRLKWCEISHPTANTTGLTINIAFLFFPKVFSGTQGDALEPIRITPEWPIYSKAMMPLKGFRDEKTKNKKQIQDFRRIMGKN